jgi:multiple sugar transport system substrate-binding protein
MNGYTPRWQHGVLLLVLAALLAACGGASAPAVSGGATTAQQPAASAEKVTITYWNGFTGPDRPAIEEMVKKFNESHPNIDVQMEITPWDGLMQKLLSTMSAGQGPDVAGVHFQFLSQYAKSGTVLDLSDQYAKGSDLDPSNFPPALVDLLKYDGKFYAAPMNYATLLMYYNKDLFKAAGLDSSNPPKDWNSWIEAIKKTSTTGANGQQYGLAIGEHETIPNWPILIWANGGDVIRDGKSALTDPKTIEALKIWTDLIKNDKISPVGLTGAEADKLFMTGKAAMSITGPWMVNGYTEAKVNFDVTPIPAGPAGAVTLADTVINMVNKNTKHKDAAVEFIKYLNSKEAQLILSSATGFPPTRLDLAGSPELAKNPWSAKFAAVAPQSRFYLGGQEKFAQIDGDVFVPMIQQITQGQSSVEDAVKQADSKLNALLK